ncbi:MAG: transglutaminase domain-containing protein [Calditrichaeota bacterium]|nr:transglutaminase domain-containing protein [Calditrichota bacterium]
MKKTPKIIASMLAILAIVIFQFCATSPYPPEVENALKKAGDNRAELEKVIHHYQETGDSLELQAAYFLIGNMDGHSFVRYELLDTSGAAVDFDVLSYPDYKTMVAAWDSVSEAIGGMDWQREETLEDLQHITADFLIENIDYAFRAWREKPWADYLSFSDFCEYVLPYRGSNEPLESWRPYFFKKFQGLAEKMNDPKDPIEATSLINDDLKTWFTFDPIFYRHPQDQALSEMLQNKKGRCEDMTNLAIYAMRANGLAVTSDYTPHWADTGNNHAWNALLDRSGKVIMFMGDEANPGTYHLRNRMAKVDRKTYSLQRNNLVFLKPEWEQVPRWLSGKNYADVTRDYVDVSDVTVTLTEPVPDSVNYAYLCVFNDGEWKAIHWGKIEGEKVTFTDMGRNIAYLPMYFVGGKLIPAGDALILEKDGAIRQLVADENDKIKIKLVSTTRRKQLADTDGIEKAFFKTGKKYHLFYWKDEWVPVGEKIAEGKPLEFSQVPSQGLYWLTEDASNKEERIFTIENGKQVWW